MDNLMYLQPFQQACKAGVITCPASDLLQYWKLVEGVLADYPNHRLTWDLAKKILDHVTETVDIFSNSTQLEESETLLVMLEHILIDFLGKTVSSVSKFISDSNLASEMMEIYVNNEAYDRIDDTIVSLRTLDKYRTVSFIIKTS